MRTLTCEVCGGKLVGKPGSIFECSTCGVEYSAEWARAKLQEIKSTVESASTIKADSPIEFKGGVNDVALLKRGQLALEDGAWKDAFKFFDEVLNFNAECAQAYLGKVCAHYQAVNVENIISRICTEQEVIFLRSNANFQKALRFADSQLVTHLQQTLDEIIRLDKENLKKAAIELPVVRQKIQPAQNLIFAGSDHIVALKSDGTVIASGDHDCIREISVWQDIVAICGYGTSTVGLKVDGTVVATGKFKTNRLDVGGWRDIVAICAGLHTVSLKADCTVVATGENDDGQCDVGGWRDIVAICAGVFHTVGLKADGTVVAIGNNNHGQCDVGGWRDIVAICAGHFYTVGLKVDGTVVVKGSLYKAERNISTWRDIVAICSGDKYIYGLKADGTVVLHYGGIGHALVDVSEWSDIVALSGNDEYAVGLKADGTVVVSGRAKPFSSEYAFVLKAGGTVVAAGRAVNRNNILHYFYKDWKLFDNLEMLESVAEKQSRYVTQAAKRRAKKIANLEAEKVALEARKTELEAKQFTLVTEMSNLNGLFAGKRRKEIKALLAEIESEKQQVVSEAIVCERLIKATVDDVL